MRWSIIFALLLSFCACTGGVKGLSGPCKNVDCGSHGQCTADNGTAACICDTGYQTNGLTCVVDNANPCGNVDCGSHGTCSADSGTAACTCDTGYHADGLSCVANLSGTSLSQYGITWTFDKEYQYGQFVTGDYWVIGPVTIISINPPSMPTTGVMTVNSWTPGTGTGYITRTLNGSELNPTPRLVIASNGAASNVYDGPRQGYDSEMYAWHDPEGRIYSPDYDATLNVALNVSSQNPLVLSAGSSLVSTVSRAGGGYSQLTDEAGLTVLAAAPPAGSFRPPYAGTDKSINFNSSDMNLNLLPSLSASGLTTTLSWYPTATALLAALNRPGLDHFNNLGGTVQYNSAGNNQPDYGRDYSSWMGEAALMLMLDPTELNFTFGITRQALAIAMCQRGIDLMGVLNVNGFFPAGGDLNYGRKLPIMLAGILFSNNTMKNVNGALNASPAWTGVHIWNAITHKFAESEAFFYVSQSDVDSGIGGYALSDIGLPEWGEIHELTPAHDTNAYTGTYRTLVTESMAGHALVCMMMESSASMMTLWNDPAFFDHQDRAMAYWAQGTVERQISRFTESMWDAYRASYGDCYTGLTNNVRQYGDCKAAGVVK